LKNLIRGMAAALAGLAFAGLSVAQTQPPIIGQPDVLILAAASADGQDLMGFTYPEVVPRAQVLRDMASLQKSSGWTFKGLKITEALPPVAGAKTKMTSAEFIAPHAIRAETHGFAVEPFVEAFRNYHHITLTYFAGQQFAFQGLRGFADNHVRVTLDQRGAAYTYQIQIRDPRFGRLKMPYLQPPISQPYVADGSVSGRTTGTVNPMFVGLAALVAVGAGLAVYFGMTRQP
jgi:hypothetical protein